MEPKQVAHDLTLMLLHDKCSNETPESIVNLYKQTFDKIYTACIDYNKEHLPKSRILPRSEW